MRQQVIDLAAALRRQALQHVAQVGPGVVAVQASGWSNGEYLTFPFSKEGRAALVNGRNIIAVHCRNNTGPGYLDVGLIEVSR